MRLNTIIGVCFFIWTVSCTQSTKKKEVIFAESNSPSNIQYAKRFSIAKQGPFTLVYLFGNRANTDTTAAFVLYHDSSGLVQFPRKIQRIKIPCKKVAALSSIYANMLSELGALNALAAIDNFDYVNNAAIAAKYHQGKLKELAKMPQIDLEQSIVLNPDIIFTFGMGEGEKDLDKKLVQTNIPVAIIVDHLEQSPLARAEWIKFFAAFVDKESRADSLFSDLKKNYLELKELASKTKNAPTVFSEIKYSDSWYVPGGKSYMAQLLKDAGADYLWKDDLQFGSLPLSFEQVYSKAKNADFWINPSSIKTKKELLSFESRYAQFKAFKTGNIYNNNKVCNNKGYSTYWESGILHPNRILSDLIHIFHPELKTTSKSDLNYYQQIN